mgnify:CR=1 FL=1
MKEATGELNMTVITVVAIAAIAALFVAFVLPRIRESISSNVENAGNIDQQKCEQACGGPCVQNGATDSWTCQDNAPADPAGP